MNESALRTLSSAQTFIMKVLFPFTWISMFGLGTLALWLGLLHDQNGCQPADPGMKWQFLFFWIVGTAFILWGCAGLKRVQVDSKFLYISNYHREISVPLNMISQIKENRWINIHPITVYFCIPTDFGQHITFMPKIRIFGLWSSHPVVAELRQLAEHAGRRCDVGKWELPLRSKSNVDYGHAGDITGY